MVLKVAVIGAGIAGLASLHRLAANPAMFEVVAFEQTSCVGGLWAYTEETVCDGRPVHSSMYDHVRSNLPKQLMEFLDFPLKEPLPTFLTHQQVTSYLNDFTGHFNIRKFIKFNTCVEKVRPLTSDAKVEWEITSRDHLASETTVETFNAVFVCNGHHSFPMIPEIVGRETFTGQILHSRDYRRPERFSGLRVVCLGAKFSGTDIAFDLAPHASQVYLCHRKERKTWTLPSNVEEKMGIKSVHGRTVVLEDDEELNEVDAIILCTGFNFNFPFLAPECDVQVEGLHAFSMYKHIIHTQRPTLAFIGLPDGTTPFTNFDCQVKFAVAVLDGTVKLPTQEEMEEDIEEDHRWRLALGIRSRSAHHLYQCEEVYNEMLAEMVGFEPLPPLIYKLHKLVLDLFKKDPLNSRKIKITVTGSETFITEPDEEQE